MSPDIIKALASLISAITDGYENSSGERYITRGASIRMGRARSALAASLGCGESWDDVAVALLIALARPDVGLPEGWTIDSDGEATNGLICVGPDGAKGIWIDGRWAPAEVVRAVLLRAAGVAS